MLTRRITRAFGSAFAEAARNGRYAKGIPNDVIRVAARKLLQLDAAATLGDLRVPPGNRLEALKGDRRGRRSIRVNDQGRVVFRWRDGDAFGVAILDDHA